MNVILFTAIFLCGVFVIVNVSLYNYFQSCLGEKLIRMESEIENKDYSEPTWIERIATSKKDHYYGDEKFLSHYPYKILMDKSQERRILYKRVNIIIAVTFITLIVIGYFV